MQKTFVGFGLGPIQAGLFLDEAFRSGNFERLVVAEVNPELVAGLQRAKGCFRINVASHTGIEVHEVLGVEVLNPAVPEQARALLAALSGASEICMALPSVEFYSRGEPSPAALLAEALRQKLADEQFPPCIVYTAENHNQAAEILQGLCEERLPEPRRAASRERVQFLNTVIGKMSGIVSERDWPADSPLAPICEGMPRAFLVEEFNKILISRVRLPGFKPGIDVFIEKNTLLPFLQAKLYGHNAVHALLGYLARVKGLNFLSELAGVPELMQLARDAFLAESGPALIARHAGVDPLFTPSGFRAHAEELLARMTNPYLRDATERVVRDTPRKLGWDDRLVGVMRLALDADIVPHCFALGVAAALETLPASKNRAAQLMDLWHVPDEPPGRKTRLIQLIEAARDRLPALIGPPRSRIP
jgi:mannitol-1-phosphate 5-dehydrogenase